MSRKANGKEGVLKVDRGVREGRGVMEGRMKIRKEKDEVTEVFAGEISGVSTVVYVTAV